MMHVLCYYVTRVILLFNILALKVHCVVMEKKLKLRMSIYR